MTNQLELAQKPFIEVQIEALVEDNRIKPKRVDAFVDDLEEKLAAIEELDYIELVDKSFRLPLVGRPNNLGADHPANFKFIPPKTVEVVGGHRTSTSLKGGYVDLAVCMPKECLSRKDIKNQQYHHKRALYLARLAHLLEGPAGRGIVSKTEFQYHQGDYLKPVLLVEPKSPKLKGATKFRIFAYPPENVLKISLLHPSHGNVAPKWFFQDYQFPELLPELETFIASNSDAYPSPFYNSNILFDLELVSNSTILAEQIGPHKSLTEALMLTKIWLYQREMHQHFSFILSMYIAYLQTKQQVHQNMSSFQIFKVIIKALASSNWSVVGLSYYEDFQEKISAMKQFFPVVFLSPSGNLNLCYNITSDMYERLKHETQNTLSLLSSNSLDMFEFSFLRKLNFVNKYDVIVHLPKCYKKLPINIELLSRFMDHGVSTPRVYSEEIFTVLRKALTDRVVLMQQSPQHLLVDKKWNHRSIPYDPSNEEHTFTFGLLLEPEKSLRIIDIGPAAQTKEAEEFRQFWDPKSQLRLQNGLISETVVWHVDSFSQRRAIIKYIMNHSLKRLGLRNVVVHYTVLERFLNLQNVSFKWREELTSDENESTGGEVSKKRPREAKKPVGVGEELFQKALRSYNELNKALRSVEGTKRLITGIQPLSHHLRNGAVFPPMPVSLQQRNKSLKRKKGVVSFPTEFNEIGKILHIEPIEILLTLETTGKWPNELEAFRAAKLDYLIQLAEALKEKEYSVKLSENYLDVLHGQFVFRLRIKCSKELAIVANSCGKVEFQKTRLELDILPRVHSSLDQLFREKPAFGITCRLIKRWISCQLLAEHLNDITVDLMTAHLFLHPQPYTEPSSSFSGFRRFLALVVEYDWAEVPLVVNFDNQLKIDEVSKLKEVMQEDRDKLPPLVICTPFDKNASPWTRSEPSPSSLKLLIKICTQALNFFDENIVGKFEVEDACKALFRPNFKLFDILIKLNPQIIQNSFMSINAPNYKISGKENTSSGPSAFKVMPPIGLNVVEQYVETLRSKYQTSASFFYDKYGQRVIGVSLKPDSEKTIAGNLKGFARDLRSLGSHLVEDIHIFPVK